MHRHPTAYFDPNCSNFFISYPNSSEGRVTLSDNIKIGKRVNDDRFKIAQVAMDVEIITIEIENRIADKLSGAVVCHVAAAINVVKVNLSGSKIFPTGQEM